MRGVTLKEGDILNEALEGKIDSKPTETLRILIKYYLSKGFDKDDIFNILDAYMISNFNGYTPSKWHSLMKGMIKATSKCNNYELLNIEEVIISEEEWNSILALDNKQLEKIAFILLIYQKINEQRNPESDGWINQNISDIFKEASVSHMITGDNTLMMLHELYEVGYISQKKSCDATSLRINYRAEGKPKIIISNFNNVISYYDEYRNNIKYSECEICSMRIAQKSKKPKKYCNKCAKNVKKEQDKIAQKNKYENSRI